VSGSISGGFQNPAVIAASLSSSSSRDARPSLFIHLPTVTRTRYVSRHQHLLRFFQNRSGTACHRTAPLLVDFRISWSVKNGVRWECHLCWVAGNTCVIPYGTQVFIVVRNFCEILYSIHCVHPHSTGFSSLFCYSLCSLSPNI